VSTDYADSQIEHIGHKKAQKAQNEIKTGRGFLIETDPESEIFF
jgi:hypothetical protein